MPFQLLKDYDAYEKLKCSSFHQKWNDLLSNCPWATSFQNIDFTNIWFDVYRDSFSPIIALEENEEGQFEHLFILAFDKKNDRIVQCGAQQAEYQSWISRSYNFDQFVNFVLSEVGKLTEWQSFKLKFLPPILSAHLDKNPLDLNYKYIAFGEEKPIIDFDHEIAPWKSLSKKGNKSKLSRLKKNGDLNLQLMSIDGIRAEEDAINLLHQVSPFYDLRQGAISDSCPFTEDRLKFEFYKTLLTKSETFKALVLKSDEKIIGCVLGAISGGEFSVGVFCYDFFLSKHSPGKFLLLLGSQLLSDIGYKAIDLTPGGDWKWRYANRREKVSELVFYNSSTSYRKIAVSRQAKSFAKVALKSIGLSPESIRNLKKQFSIKGHGSTNLQKMNLYSIAKENIKPFPGGGIFDENSIKDFLKFETTIEYPTRQVFLSEALRKFEGGYTSFTQINQDKLIHNGWLSPVLRKLYLPELEREVLLEEAGSVFIKSVCHIAGGQRDAYLQFFATVFSKILRNDDIHKVYVAVAQSDDAQIQAIQKIGFKEASD